MSEWYGVDINQTGGHCVYIELKVDDVRRLENGFHKVKDWRLGDETLPCTQEFQGRRKTYRFKDEECVYAPTTLHVDLTEVVSIEVWEAIGGEEI